MKFPPELKRAIERFRTEADHSWDGEDRTVIDLLAELDRFEKKPDDAAALNTRLNELDAFARRAGAVLEGEKFVTEYETVLEIESWDGVDAIVAEYHRLFPADPSPDF